ncbi:MAG: patatin-like phospholipase family protein [Bryobacteraceae bacterium]
MAPLTEVAYDSGVMATQNPTAWRSNEFKLGINMAGAVSAGAYTAGVLDFLLEALEEWEKAKTAFRASLANPAGASAAPVPLHDVTIEAFGGASAGGMCAAIAAVMVQQEFAHIRSAMEAGTSNTLYESWVNRIGIERLLGTRDIENGGALVSLLDSTVIDEIAREALQPSAAKKRSYISRQLTLLLTLTNVRGIPYRLYSDPTGGDETTGPTADEYTAYYGDRLRFETTEGDQAPSHPSAKALPAGTPGAGSWPLLQEATKATGAFPIMLAPRRLTREKTDYVTPPWETTQEASGEKSAQPDWRPQPPTIETLNVDGGVTDNNPFQLVNDVLLSLQSSANVNPSGAEEANCAVVTVAPFPATWKWAENYDTSTCSAIWPMLGRLLDVLISQSRFMGESLSELTNGASFNRFVIAPSDSGWKKGSALQCAVLNAFGGFFFRGFRRHDFLLGRRNCQRFLRAHFCLPTNNTVIAAGLREAGSWEDEIQRQFGVPAPVAETGTSETWLPVIPVMGTAESEVANPAREKMPREELDRIVGLILKRAKAIRPLLLADAPGFVRWTAGIVLRWPFSILIKRSLRATLVERMGDSVEPS